MEHAHAASKHTSLNQNNITDFIQTTTAISNGDSGELDSQEVMDYLENHLHDQARFISEMTYVIPGFTPQTNSMSVGKGEFIEHVRQAEDAVTNYQSNIEILNIVISSNKRSATVSTRAQENGEMVVVAGEAPVTVAGTSECTQILMLSPTGVIQMFNARCKTRINFDEF